MRERGQRGVATLELMLLAPLLFLVAAGVVQVALVALAHNSVGDAALAAARADALHTDPQQAAESAMAGVASAVRARLVAGPGEHSWQVTAQVVAVFPGADIEVEDTAHLP